MANRLIEATRAKVETALHVQKPLSLEAFGKYLKRHEGQLRAIDEGRLAVVVLPTERSKENFNIALLTPTIGRTYANEFTLPTFSHEPVGIGRRGSLVHTQAVLIAAQAEADFMRNLLIQTVISPESWVAATAAHLITRAEESVPGLVIDRMIIVPDPKKGDVQGWKVIDRETRLSVAAQARARNIILVERKSA